MLGQVACAGFEALYTVKHACSCAVMHAAGRGSPVSMITSASTLNRNLSSAMSLSRTQGMLRTSPPNTAICCSRAAEQVSSSS